MCCLLCGTRSSARCAHAHVWVSCVAWNSFGLTHIPVLTPKCEKEKRKAEKTTLCYNRYGQDFDVRPERNPINIAYTNAGLSLHMDLPYYESPPGIQFLHCLQNNVFGGESTLLDVQHCAALFREEQPAHFQTLCEVPATFVKDHLERDNPAQMYYRRPHFSLDPVSGDVASVFWSPSFEGVSPVAGLVLFACMHACVCVVCVCVCVFACVLFWFWLRARYPVFVCTIRRLLASCLNGGEPFPVGDGVGEQTFGHDPSGPTVAFAILSHCCRTR